MTIKRIEHNLETGETGEIVVDDTWILAHLGKEIELSITSSSLAVGASATLSAQLMSPTLSDGNRQALNEALAIRLQLGDVALDVNLVNGAWSDTLQFPSAGTYKLFCLSHSSNTITVEVT